MQGTPIFKDLLFEDCDFITSDLGFAATFSGLKEAPVQNLTLRNVNFYPAGKNPAWPHPRPKPGFRNSSTQWGPCEYVDGVCDGGTSLESCPPCFTMKTHEPQTDWVARRSAFVNSVFGPSANGKLPSRSQPDVGPVQVRVSTQEVHLPRPRRCMKLSCTLCRSRGRRCTSPTVRGTASVTRRSQRMGII